LLYSADSNCQIWYRWYRANHKMTPKWAWPGSRDQISKFWDPPYNFGTNRAIRFKFGTDIDDAPLRRANHKMTLKWAWPGSRDPGHAHFVVNVNASFLRQNWQCACVVSRDRVVGGHPKPHIWNQRPQFAYSLYNFYRATTTIKGSLHGSTPL